MDYAIYKTRDGKNPRIIHRFTQEACNHRAKRAATVKLHEMWVHVINRGFPMPRVAQVESFPTTTRQALTHQNEYAST